MKCTRIIYFALGQEHRAYAHVGYTMEAAKELIGKIYETSYVFIAEECFVDKNTFDTLNINKINEWLDNLNKFENKI